MDIQTLAPYAVLVWLIVGVLIIGYLTTLLLKSLGKQLPQKILIKIVKDKPTEDPLKAVVQEAFKTPIEPLLRPKMTCIAPEADGKILLVCDKCQAPYRVNPNRDFYTCSTPNCWNKMMVPKVEVKSKSNGKDKTAPKRAPLLQI